MHARVRRKSILERLSGFGGLAFCAISCGGRRSRSSIFLSFGRLVLEEMDVAMERRVEG